jgi:hypothetical protein
MTMEGAVNGISPTGEAALSKREIIQQIEYEQAFSLLSNFVAEGDADRMAYTYAIAPPFLKKGISKKIKQIVKDGGIR